MPNKRSKRIRRAEKSVAPYREPTTDEVKEALSRSNKRNAVALRMLAR